MLTRGGRRLAMIEPLPHRLSVARVMTVPYAPNRVLDGLKTLSYAGNMLAGRLAKEQGFETTLPADDLHVTIAFSRARAIRG